MANPKIGQSATLNGKKVVWSGQNYGYQSPATHNKLKDQGKFKTGAQALDRLGNAIPKPVKDVANEVKKRLANGPIQPVNAGYKGTNATDRVLQSVSDKTNVDRRIVDGAATVAQAAISKAALKGGGAAKANPQPRSVGAAGRPAPTAPTTRRLHTPRTDGVVRPSSSTPKPAAPKPSLTPAEAQRLKTGVQGAATRQGVGTTKASVTRTQNLPKPQGKDGQRVFTPTNRAQVVQRSNARQARGAGYTADDGSNHRTISTAGMSSKSSLVPRNAEWNSQARNTPTNARPKRNNDITFKPAYSEGFDRASERGGAVRRSRTANEIRSANIKDQLGHQLNRTRTGDHVTATPVNDLNRRTGEYKNTSARARYYQQQSGGALSSTKTKYPDGFVSHNVNARRGSGNNWTNPANSKDVGNGRKVNRPVKWDPNDLHGDLNKLASRTKQTLLGRRAGGNSNIKVKVKKEAAPRSVGAAGKPDTKGGGGRTLFRPGKDGVVTKSGDKVRGKVSNYTAQIGPRTKTNTPTARRVAAQTSTAARRSQGNVTAKAPVRSGRPKAQTIPVGGPVTASKGTPVKGRAIPAKPSATGKKRASIQRDISAVQGRTATRVRNALDGKPTPARSTNNRLAPGVRNSATVRPPRSSSTRMTREEQRQTLRSTLRGRGDAHVQATVGNRDVANQVRRSPNRGGGTMTTYGETNARRSAAAQTTTPTRSGGRNSVQNNARGAGRQAVDRFEGRARTIVNDRIRREGENMTSRERQALTRQLQRQMRQGSNRVRAAAEGQSTRTANETRSNTRNFQGSGRTAYQEPNRNDRRGGRSEAQMRRRASALRIRQTTPQGRTTTVNPRATTDNPRVSPAVNMRRRRTAS